MHILTFNKQRSNIQNSIAQQTDGKEFQSFFDNCENFAKNRISNKLVSPSIASQPEAEL